MLTLKEFVRDTLTQIVEATEEFEKSDAGNDVTVCPNISSAGAAAVANTEAGLIPPINVTFDIAVSTVDEASAKGGGQIKVLSAFAAGGEGEKLARAESISRVSFSLPLLFMKTARPNVDISNFTRMPVA